MLSRSVDRHISFTQSSIPHNVFQQIRLTQPISSVARIELDCLFYLLVSVDVNVHWRCADDPANLFAARTRGKRAPIAVYSVS